MSRALFYLWIVLLKRRSLQFIRGLWRPTRLIGFIGPVLLVGYLFQHRDHEVFGQLVRNESLFGGALIMLIGSIFKGLLQRGLIFDPPDFQFLFTGPFTRGQIVLYRLWPGYIYALVQGIVFFSLFSHHLKNPAIVAAGVTFCQVACFHLATGAAIYVGTLAEGVQHRLRWGMLASSFLVAALYLRVAWDLHPIPPLLSSPLSQLLFYPALRPSDVAGAPVIHDWMVNWASIGAVPLFETSLAMGTMILLAVGAGLSLWLLLGLKAEIFEPALSRSVHVAGPSGGRPSESVDRAATQGRQLSLPFPNWPFFRGVGAIVWKNLVMARRSRRDLILAAGVTVVYTGFLVALRWALHRMLQEGGDSSKNDAIDFDFGLACLLSGLGFFLQRSFPFDFRREANHLAEFRTLPVSPWNLVLAEMAVPTIFCLSFQGLGALALILLGGVGWSTLVILLLTFPAVAVALNGVWNLHYLLAATRRANGRADSASPVGLVMVVALSFLIFYPAGWTAFQVGQVFVDPDGGTNRLTATVDFLAVQYPIDVLLIGILAKLLERNAFSRDMT